MLINENFYNVVLILINNILLDYRNTIIEDEITVI